MKIILCAVETSLAEAWRRFCGDLDAVTIHQGSIFDLSCDAVVSPANSFGFMNGGIDLLYSQYFGWHVQEQLQQAIKTRHYGELLVGQAEIIETDHAQIPFVIAAPTMRVPMILRDSINPFLAARAVLLLIAHGIFSTGRFAGQRVSDHVKTVAFPGLGTGVGQVGANTCAHQVRAAIEQVVLGNTQFPVSWTVAQQQHQLLYTDRVRNLQKE